MWVVKMNNMDAQEEAMDTYSLLYYIFYLQLYLAQLFIKRLYLFLFLYKHVIIYLEDRIWKKMKKY